MPDLGAFGDPATTGWKRGSPAAAPAQLFCERAVNGWRLGALRILNPLGIVAHNAILEIGVGLGIIGILLFGSILYSLLVSDTRMAEYRARALAAGGLIVVSVPIFLSGSWDQSAAAWIAIALCSRVAYVSPL